MTDKKRKASNRDDLVEEPISKVAKTNIDQYKIDNSVLVLTFETDNDDNYHIPQLYTFPETLLKCYKYIIKNLDTRKNAYKPVSKEVLKTIEHLEDVKLLYVEHGKDSDMDPITYMDVWTNAIEYWRDRDLIKFLPDTCPINDHVNITIVKCLKVLEI